MKRHSLSFLLPLLALAACEKPFEEQEIPHAQAGDALEFTATMEQIGGDTKTALDAERDILWQAGDQITIFQKSAQNNQYRLSAGEGTTNAKFSEVTPVAPDQNGNAVAETGMIHNLAVYPYSDRYSMKNDDNGCNIDYVEIPFYQNYVPGSYDPKAFPMIAVTENTNLQFMNMSGILKLQLTGEDKIKTITVRSDGSDFITGTTILRVPKDNPDTWTSVLNEYASSHSVQMDCGEGVQLSEIPTAFHICLAPSDLDQGFEVQVEAVNGKIGVLKAPAVPGNKIQRNQILSMPPVKIVADQERQAPTDNQIWVKTVGNKQAVLNGHLLYNGQPVMKDWTVSSEMNASGYWVYTNNRGKIDMTCLFYDMTDIEEVFLPQDVRRLGVRPFHNCSALKKVHPLDNIEEIRDGAFYNTAMTVLNLPNTLKRLQGTNIFEASRLEKLEIPENTISQDNIAMFVNCKNLQELIVRGRNLHGENMFTGCSDLRNIRLLNKEFDTGSETFNGFLTEYCSLTIHQNNPKKPTDDVTWNGKKWWSISLVDDAGNVVKTTGSNEPAPGYKDMQPLNEIWAVSVDGKRPEESKGPSEYYKYALSQQVNEKGFWVYTIPTGSEYSISSNRLNGLTSIKELYLPLQIETIDYNAFDGCSNLEKIVLPESLKSIQPYAFQNCGLKTVTLPRLLNGSLMESAFKGCTALEEVTFAAADVPGDYREPVFEGCTALRKITFTDPDVKIGMYLFLGKPRDPNSSGDITSKCDLFIHKDCTTEPSGNVWSGYTWKSISYIDDKGNVVQL